MINGICTGFSHSGSLANIVLLYYEIKNKFKLYRSIDEYSAEYEPDTINNESHIIRCKIVME